MRPKMVINHLEFYYNKKQALFDLCMEVPANKILALIGPAGSGITTALRSLNRLYELTPGARAEGEVLLDGKNIHDSDVSVTQLRRRVGMVFDVPTPLPMSILDNVTYGPRLQGRLARNKKALAELAEQALTQATLWDEVKDRLQAPAMSLSGGQQQRLCIARVLALRPEVILLDRPCSGLDPISTAKIEDSLTKLKQEFTIVIAPHNVQQAGRVADRVAFLLSGRLIEEGKAAELFANPRDERTSDYITGRFG